MAPPLPILPHSHPNDWIVGGDGSECQGKLLLLGAVEGGRKRSPQPMAKLRASKRYLPPPPRGAEISCDSLAQCMPVRKSSACRHSYI